MRISIVLTAVLFALTQTIFGQQISDTQKAQHPVLKTKAVNKRSYGIYGSVSGVYNSGGLVVPIENNTAAGLGGSYTTTESNIKQTLGFGGSGGFELISKENSRWYRVFSFGISYYSYYASAIQTVSSVYYFNPPVYTTSQTTNTDLFNYTLVDLSFWNYIRIIESLTQRLGAGIGATVSANVYNNTPESAPTSEDIPIMCLFISPCIRYDISLKEDELISIEPYYNYEIRNVANTYPRLASFGLKLSLLFN